MPDPAAFHEEDDRAAGGAECEQALQDRLRRDLQRYLRIREHTRWEVGTYLRRRRYPEATIANALVELCDTGLVNDRRFAEVFLRDRQRLRPMSCVAVLRELRAKGVEPSVAQEALAACDPPWDDEQLACDLLKRRWARWGSEGRPERATRFLTRRGFSRDVIRAALRHAEDENPRAH
jgi:regulatory protein